MKAKLIATNVSFLSQNTHLKSNESPAITVLNTVKNRVIICKLHVDLFSVHTHVIHVHV